LGLVLAIALCAIACMPPPDGAVRRTVRARLHDRALAEDEIGVDRADVRGLLARPLGPEDAARVALLHNPEAAAAIDELGVASANLLADSLPPNPELDSETRLGRRGAGDELEAHVVVDVTALVTLPLRRAAAEAELEAAQLRAAHEVLDLAYETRAAFIRFQAAMERRAWAQTTVEAARAAFEIARALNEAGNVPMLNVVVPEGLYEESRLALSRADLEVLDLREELHVLMGLSGDETEWRARERLADLPSDEQDLEALEQRAIERSLLLAEAEQRLVALARRHGVARVAGLVPDLRAGVSGSLADQVLAFGPALSITLPLFDQGIADADRIEARVNVERRRYLATAIEVRSMVRRARNRLLAAREQERFIRETLLPVRARALQEALLQYNAMAATPFQLLEARRDEITAGRALVDARRDYWLAHIALERILAGGSARLEPLEARDEMGARSQGGH
jgi:cobalt-zinc-cadmium efflux system outer membrane protein